MTAAPVMSITDELVAELEAAARESIYGCPTWLERDGYSLSWADASDVNHIVTAAPSVVLSLLAERAQLKRDAERYWWLNNSPHSFGILRAMSTGDLTGPMVDDAIDTAMQAAQ